MNTRYAIPPIIGITGAIAHHPGLPTNSNIFQCQIIVYTKNIIPVINPKTGMKYPMSSSHGHQCILDAFHVIISGPIAGIHAIAGLGYFVFFAIAINAKLV